MGHRSSRSTLPSNYIHLRDDNRSIDVSTIKGNISDDLERSGQALAAWDFFVSTEDKSFGLGAANIGKRSKFQPNSTGHTRELIFNWSYAIFSGTLHGACAAYIVDQYVLYSIYEFVFRSLYAYSCSVSSLILLGTESLNLWISYGITQLKCKYIIYSHAQASNWLGERS